VTLAANVVTINPDANLAAGTLYRLVVADGALRQNVDANGAANANGTSRPVQGLTISFATAP
jgi:hypothetical protein